MYPAYDLMSAGSGNQGHRVHVHGRLIMLVIWYIGLIVQPLLRKYSGSIRRPNWQSHNFCPRLSCPFSLLPPWIWDGCEGRREERRGRAGKHQWGLIREIRSGGSDSQYNSNSDLTANVLHPAHLIQFTSIIFSLFVLTPPPSCHLLLSVILCFFPYILEWGGESVQMWQRMVKDLDFHSHIIKFMSLSRANQSMRFNNISKKFSFKSEGC